MIIWDLDRFSMRQFGRTSVDMFGNSPLGTAWGGVKAFYDELDKQQPKEIIIRWANNSYIQKRPFTYTEITW